MRQKQVQRAWINSYIPDTLSIPKIPTSSTTVLIHTCLQRILQKCSIDTLHLNMLTMSPPKNQVAENAVTCVSRPYYSSLM